MSRRGATGLSGILLLDKPADMTSHDVVDIVRRATGERRVGHAGTLDPAATGLLIVLVGPATRLAPYLTSADKTYNARIVFGHETSTDDAEGEITRTAAIPPGLTNETAATVKLADLVGEDMQMPPAYSAIKKDGRTSYKEARAGRDMELEPRHIQIIDAFLLGVEPGPPAAWNLTLNVSKGTYIRAIARDLGRDLGTAAHLAMLRRTASGPLNIKNAYDLKKIQGADEFEELFTPAIDALGMTVVNVDPETAARIGYGQALKASGEAASIPEGKEVAVAQNGRLLALYTRAGAALKPAVVIPGGVT